MGLEHAAAVLANAQLLEDTLHVLHVHVLVHVLRQLQLARVDAVVANGTEDLLHSEAIS